MQIIYFYFCLQKHLSIHRNNWTILSGLKLWLIFWNIDHYLCEYLLLEGEGFVEQYLARRTCFKGLVRVISLLPKTNEIVMNETRRLRLVAQIVRMAKKENSKIGLYEVNFFVCFSTTLDLRCLLHTVTVSICHTLDTLL